MSAAYRIDGEPSGTGRFVVPSDSIEGIAWIVEVLSGRRIRCACMGFLTRNGCRHARLTREAWDAEPRPTLATQLEQSVRRERNRQTAELLAN